MKTINVNASRKYDVRIGAGMLTAVSTEKLSGRTVMVVSDDTVASLYGERLNALLKQADCRVLDFTFPHGEQSKTLSTYEKLTEEMCREGMTRSDLLIALGGGVTGDLTGFAAATYRRGIDFLQIPTTLLAAVDSSVGGKTGVDLKMGKNQIGAFYQPCSVLCDTDTLKTLPEEEYENGCAEVIKYAMIGNRSLYDSIKETPVKNQYEEVIGTCVAMKRDIVEKDEFDTGMRMLLNFGHTVGHAVETCSGYSIPHGKAVAIGMAVITKAAAAKGRCSQEVYDSLISLLEKYGLPVQTSYPAEMLSAAMMGDKKASGDSITFIIPKETGRCVTENVPKEDVPDWLHAGGIE